MSTRTARSPRGGLVAADIREGVAAFEAEYGYTLEFAIVVVGRDTPSTAGDGHRDH